MDKHHRCAAITSCLAFDPFCLQNDICPLIVFLPELRQKARASDNKSSLLLLYRVRFERLELGEEVKVDRANRFRPNEPIPQFRPLSLVPDVIRENRVQRLLRLEASHFRGNPWSLNPGKRDRLLNSCPPFRDVNELIKLLFIIRMLV